MLDSNNNDSSKINFQHMLKMLLVKTLKALQKLYLQCRSESSASKININIQSCMIRNKFTKAIAVVQQKIYTYMLSSKHIY